DTINGRVRITNSPKNVGVKGQVTGWIDVSVAIELNKTTNASILAAANIPSYEVNAVYVVQYDDVVVRRGPGTSYEPVGYAGLTANAKKYDKNKTGCLFRGVKVTCQAIEAIGSNVWMKIPSGWIAAYYDKKYFVK
ncbi:MAG: hypothetical protein NC489_32660, partial [Ruminococcus flavefaciens]|nr:hypothetical protein [Ruminococcus flavefaciens]